MTRDEAVALVHKCNGGIGAEGFVDALSILGALKLEDPAEQCRLEAIAYLEEKFVEVQSTGNARNSERLTRAGAAEILDILLKSGFKITR